jgi:putative membrane protein
MKPLTGGICITTLAALLSIGTAHAQTAAQNATKNPAPDPVKETTDTTFARGAASGGMAEVSMGKLAQQKGSSDSVKEFGKRMETDHSAAGDKLKDIAGKDGITIPGGMSQKDQATYNKLSKLSGADFDKAYATQMVQDHQKDIAEFQKEASNGSNPDVKNFATETLPTLQEHLRMAQDMQKTVGGQ